MKLKYILFYIAVFIIIVLTIFGMFYLKDHTTFEEKKKNIVSEIKINEATKEDKTKEWVYNSSLEDKIKIPYINIDDKDIDKLNEKISKNDGFISSDYLYSINNNLLSILFIKTYSDIIKYETYHINLNSTKIVSDLESLNYINKDIYDIKDNCNLSLEHEIKNYHFDQEKYEEYLKNTLSEFSKSIYNGSLKIYIGNNKEIMVIMNLYLDEIKPIIINIVDK